MAGPILPLFRPKKNYRRFIFNKLVAISWLLLAGGISYNYISNLYSPKSSIKQTEISAPSNTTPYTKITAPNNTLTPYNAKTTNNYLNQSNQTPDSKNTIEERLYIDVRETSITQEKFSFSYQIRTKDGERYIPKILEKDEEVIFQGVEIPTEKIYLEEARDFTLRKNQVLFKGNKLFRVSITPEGNGYKIVPRKNAKTLRLDVNVPYSIPIKSESDGVISSDEIKFFFPGQIIGENLFAFNNDLEISIQGYTPKELLIPTPVHDERSSLEFHELKREGGYIIGEIDPVGVLQVLIPGEIRQKQPAVELPKLPKPIPTLTPTPTPTPILTPIPGTIKPKTSIKQIF